MRLSRAQSPESSFSQESLDPYTAICDTYGNPISLPYGPFGGYAGSAVNGTVVRNMSENAAFKSFSFSPMDILEENIETARRARIRPFVSADFKFLNMFKYSLLYQYEWGDYKNELLSDKNSYVMRMTHNALVDANGASQLPEGARYNQFNSSSKRYTLRNQLSFDKTINNVMKADTTLREASRLEQQLAEHPEYFDSLRFDMDTPWEEFIATVLSMLTYGWSLFMMKMR